MNFYKYLLCVFMIGADVLVASKVCEEELEFREKTDAFVNLNADIITYGIWPYLGPEGAFNLGRTSRNMMKLFNEQRAEMLVPLRAIPQQCKYVQEVLNHNDLELIIHLCAFRPRRFYEIAEGHFSLHRQNHPSPSKSPNLYLSLQNFKNFAYNYLGVERGYGNENYISHFNHITLLKTVLTIIASNVQVLEINHSSLVKRFVNLFSSSSVQRHQKILNLFDSVMKREVNFYGVAINNLNKWERVEEASSCWNTIFLPPEAIYIQPVSLTIVNSRITMLPSELSYMHALNNIYFFKTDIFFLPEEFYKISTLRSVIFSSASKQGKLSYISSEIINLKNLEFFDLTGQMITCLPQEIKSLPRLKKILPQNFSYLLKQRESDSKVSCKLALGQDR